MSKYLMTQKWVEKLAPNLKISELTRTACQKLLNDYAKDYERQTTLDFHHQLKGAIPGKCFGSFLGTRKENKTG